MAQTDKIRVEVAYALPDRQQIIGLDVAPGTTALEAVRMSGIDKRFPDLDIENADMGIFAKAVARPAEQVLAEGDRVEIYRPLIADPKEVRKQRAARLKEAKQAN